MKSREESLDEFFCKEYTTTKSYVHYVPISKYLSLRIRVSEKSSSTFLRDRHGWAEKGLNVVGK